LRRHIIWSLASTSDIDRPSLGEIAASAGTDEPRIRYNMLRLRDRGLVTWTPHKWRSWRLTDKGWQALAEAPPQRPAETPAYQLYGELALISGTASRLLSAEIAKHMGCQLLNAEIFKFANDNTLVRLLASVRGRDVFFVQPTCPPTNDNLMELLIALDAIKRDSAARITAVIPYYGYGRSDKKDEPRVPITARLVADMITVAGADRVLTMDLHAGQIQGFFSIPVDDVTAQHLLAEYFKSKNIKKGVTVSPDVGRVKDARNFAQMLDMPLSIVEKRRGADGGDTAVLNLIGDVEGRDAVIIDDEIDTAGTMAGAAKFLKQQGARHVYGAATHAIFSDPAVERLRQAEFREIVVTNTVRLAPRKRMPNLTVISVAPLLAEVIRRIHEGVSVGQLFDE
jgi:ribose-phosphate pyrophosphokinase